jgi:hypothetical protein
MSPTLPFGLGLIGLGVFWIWHAVHGRNVVVKAADWPSIDGVITESEVGRSGGANPKWEARVRYLYRVGGATVENDRVTLGGSFRGSRTRAEQRVAKYPVGADVTVHYNPEDPRRAFLELAHDAWWLEIIVGVFGLIGGAVLLLRA